MVVGRELARRVIARPPRRITKLVEVKLRVRPASKKTYRDHRVLPLDPASSRTKTSCRSCGPVNAPSIAQYGATLANASMKRFIMIDTLLRRRLLPPTSQAPAMVATPAFAEAC